MIMHNVNLSSSFALSSIIVKQESGHMHITNIINQPKIFAKLSSNNMHTWLCDCVLYLCMQPAEMCIHYPVKHYLLVIRSLSGIAINVTLGCNETETFLTGLENNMVYTYSVTVINRIGNATTNSEKVLCEFNHSAWFL